MLENKMQNYLKFPKLGEKTILILSIFFIFFIIANIINSEEFILDPVKKPIATTTEPVFLRILDSGMSGQDVKALQMIIALENEVSQETSGIFTATTKQNVKKLQEKYPLEILIPMGLSFGNGVVGTTTIPILNKLAVQYNIKLSDFTPVQTVTTSATSSIINIFTRDLKLGDRGDDVKILKTILNSDFRTALIYINNKAPAGSEDLFDTATESAVKRFQEKYANEILTPNGLTRGTGVVGYTTRVKLNKILADIAAEQAKKDAAAKSAGATTTTTQKISTPTGIIQTVVPNAPLATSGTKTQYPYEIWEAEQWGECDAPGWVYCAEEAGTCSFSGTTRVRYGSGARWTYGSDIKDSIACNNSSFGDPAPGVHKQCYYWNGTGTQTRTVTLKETRYYSVEIKSVKPSTSQKCTIYPGASTGITTGGTGGTGDITGGAEDVWCKTDSNSFNFGGLSDSACDVANGAQKFASGDILGGTLDMVGGVVNVALTPVKGIIDWVGSWFK